MHKECVIDIDWKIFFQKKIYLYLPYLKFSDPLPKTHLFLYLGLSQLSGPMCVIQVKIVSADSLRSPATCKIIQAIIQELDWLQSLKQFFIDVSYILVASLTLMALLKTEPSELDRLLVYDMTHWWKIILRAGAISIQE